MTTKGALPAGSGFGAQPRGGALSSGPNPSLAGGPAAQAKPKPPSSGSSFLDDWLSKRQGFQAPASASVAPAATPSTPSPKPPSTTATPVTPPATIQPAQHALPDVQAPAKPLTQPEPIKTPQAPPATGAATPASPKNISSNELVQHEVDEIAAELKQKLNTPTPTPTPKLTHGSEVHPNEDDTIFIDHDGSFHLATDLKKTDSQKAENS